MNRVALVLLLLFATQAAAQTKPVPKPKPVAKPTTKTRAPARKHADLTRVTGREPALAPLQVVPSRVRLRKRLIFVVDVSGSMANGDRFAQAIGSVLLILGYKSDEQEIAAITFCGKTTRWPGKPECLPHKNGTPCVERCVPTGWAQMWPKTVKALVKWLQTRERSGVTEPAPALTSAILEPRSQLSVIFISDGEFNEATVLKAVKKAQKKRRKNGYRPAHIMVWGAGGAAKDQPALKKLAKLGLGGFWVHGEKHSGPW